MSSKLRGQHPAIILDNPKYSHNVGAVVRTASAFGVGQVWWTGKRVTIIEELIEEVERLQTLVPKPRPTWVWKTPNGTFPA